MLNTVYEQWSKVVVVGVVFEPVLQVVSRAAMFPTNTELLYSKHDLQAHLIHLRSDVQLMEIGMDGIGVAKIV